MIFKIYDMNFVDKYIYAVNYHRLLSVKNSLNISKIFLSIINPIIA